MEPPSLPPRPSPALRGFGIAFAATALPPLLVIGAATVAQDGLGALVIGAMVAAAIDLFVLIVALVRLIQRQPDGLGLLIGFLAGVTVGFGGCALMAGVL